MTTWCHFSLFCRSTVLVPAPFHAILPLSLMTMTLISFSLPCSFNTSCCGALSPSFPVHFQNSGVPTHFPLQGLWLPQWPAFSLHCTFILPFLTSFIASCLDHFCVTFNLLSSFNCLPCHPPPLFILIIQPFSSFFLQHLFLLPPLSDLGENVESDCFVNTPLSSCSTFFSVHQWCLLLSISAFTVKQRSCGSSSCSWFLFSPFSLSSLTLNSFSDTPFTLSSLPTMQFSHHKDMSKKLSPLHPNSFCFSWCFCFLNSLLSIFAGSCQQIF